jgi:lysophospholipase L1-like esterase
LSGNVQRCIAIEISDMKQINIRLQAALCSRLLSSLTAASAALFLMILSFSAVSAQEVSPKLGAYKNQRMGMFSLTRLSGAAVVMLGDSLTERAQWAEITGCPFVANRGIGGDTSKGILMRVDSSIQLKPRAVFLMVGINDISSGVSNPVIAGNLERILDTLQAARIHVFLAYVLPVTKTYKLKINPQVDDLNKAIEKFHQRPGVSAVDLRPKMADGDGNLRSDLSTDGIHLNTEGYRIWRDTVTPLVEAHCTSPSVVSQLH